MDKCPCLNAKVTVSGDVHAKVSCNDGIGASVSMGTVLIRDGTNDYERLIHKPSIEGHTLIQSVDSGIILTSPGGIKYKLGVDDSGNLTTTAV